MATTTQKSGLTFKHKVGYAMGDLGGCMTFALMGAMVTRYYTNVLQVNRRPGDAASCLEHLGRRERPDDGRAYGQNVRKASQ